MKALELATPTLRDLARDAGIKYETIRQYRKGARMPSPEIRARLVRALRAHAERLGRAARHLERGGAR